MTTYSNEFKEKLIKLMLPPENKRDFFVHKLNKLSMNFMQFVMKKLLNIRIKG
jgi:hypothetical protein